MTRRAAQSVVVSAARVLLRSRRVLALMLGCLAVGASGAAWAYWTAGATPGSGGAGAAASVNQGATPTATAGAGRTVAVSWGASTLSNGHAVDGYIISRYDAVSGLPQTVLGGCAGTVVSTSCTESDVPSGQWQYTVTPVMAANWRGSEGLKSGSATIGPSVLTLAKTLFGAPLPQTTTGTLSGYAANEGVTYRLDAGTALTATPASVGAAGSAAITALTVPSASDGPHTVFALGSAAPNASQASLGIVIDTTPPTASAALSPVPNGAGWNNSAPVAVTLSASDGAGSGVAQIRYTTDGSDPTSSPTAQTYSTPLPRAVSATVKYIAVDNAGNVSPVQTQAVNIDTQAPTNALTLTGVSGGAWLAGTTVFYRGASAGSFTLTNALADAGGSGPASSGTAALAGTTTGWSHSSSLVSAPAGGPYVSNPFSWTAGSSASPTEALTGSDVAANTTTATLTFTNDTTAPSGGAVDATGLSGTGGRYSTSLTLHPSFTKGADAGSGLAAAGAQLLRASAPLSSVTGTADGTCGAYGAYAQVGANDPLSPVSDSVPSDNRCYRYEYLVGDNVGNVATYTSPDIKVQTGAPATLTPTSALITPLTGAGAQSVSGATVYYNPALTGSFTVDSSASDATSGVAQLSFPALAGFAGGGNVTLPTAGSTYRATYSWSANAASASPGAQSVIATNNASTSATNASAFSVIKDSASPAGGSVDAVGLSGTGARYSTSLNLSLAFSKGADGGSGLAPTGAQLLRASAPLSSSAGANGTCGVYGAFAQVGANDPSSPRADTVPADHACYRYQYLVADNVGNQATYTSPDIKVDTTAPAAPALSFSAFSNSYWSGAGNSLFYRPGAAAGAFTATATASDGVSGIGAYAFPALPAGWSATPGALGVNTYSWSAANPTAPAGNQNVTATNNAGLISAPAPFTVVADSTPPAGGTITYTGGYYTAASVGVTFSAGADGGSGLAVASGVLQRAAAPLSGGSCGAFGAYATVAVNPASPYSDNGVANGNCYQYRYLISDNVGNQATYASATTAKVDTQGPTHALSLSSPVGAVLSGGTLYYKGSAAGSFALTDSLSDLESGAASSTFAAIATAGWTHAAETVSNPPGGPFTSSTLSWLANPSNPTAYAVGGRDVAGNLTSLALPFASDITPPAGGSITYTDGIVTVASVPIATSNGTDAQSGVNPGSGIVRRDQATLNTATETCGAFAGTYATTVTLVGGADTTVASGNCYRYEYLISDNLANQATLTSASVAKVDMSGPQVTAIASQQADGSAGNGQLEVGDQLIITFSEPLAAASVPTGTFTGATEHRQGNQTVKLTIPGITSGAVDTGSSGYLAKNTTATFGGTIALVNNGASTTITVTVTSLSGAATLASSGAMVFQIDPTQITDVEGDHATGTFTTPNTFALF